MASKIHKWVGALGMVLASIGTAAQAADEPKIGFLVKQAEEPWFQDEWKFAEQAAREKGFKLIKIGVRAAIVPADLIVGNAQYRPDMVGLDVPQNIYAHIAGIDIVRTPDAQGEYYVLEDNLRVPSGVSYMLENRKMMMRLFPELFSRHKVAPVAHYPDMLLDAL
ncbi:hypothetical protein ET532_024435, partial [Verminephrobacter sp. Larva24]